jgi:hypothetical protein
VNQFARNDGALYNDGTGGVPQFSAVSFKRVGGSSEASPSGTWKNLGPGYAANGGVKPYGGHGLNLFVRVS